jgi:hypothetical protein
LLNPGQRHQVLRGIQLQRELAARQELTFKIERERREPRFPSCHVKGGTGCRRKDHSSGQSFKNQSDTPFYGTVLLRQKLVRLGESKGRKHCAAQTRNHSFNV